jgi:DNA invertase Pin-like site-specific DNA recombinase
MAMAHYKVLALMRASTKEQDLERQKSDIDFHVARFAEDGIEVEIVETFELHGISGAIAQATPEFKRMLTRLQDPTISGILISQLDRFLRPENADAYAALKIFRTGKKLMFCDAKRPLDITDSEDRSVIINTLEQAYMERRRIKHRTHSKKELLIQDPTVSVTRLPNGVKHVKDIKRYGPKTKKGWFEYTDYAFSHIKVAFERYAAGESMMSLCGKIGFPSQAYLREILKNKWWIGILDRTKQVTITYDEETGEKIRSKRHAHPKPIVNVTNLAETPLVPVELWERVQSLLGINAKNFTFTHSNANDFLFNGKLFCGKCGARLYIKNDTKRANQPPTYICSSYNNSWRKAKVGKAEKGEPCGFRRLSAEDLDLALFSSCADTFKNKEWVNQVVAAALDTTEAMSRKNDLAAAVERLEGLEKKKKAIQRMVAVDDTDEDSLHLFMACKRDIAEAQIRLATAKAEAEPFGTDDPNGIATAIAARWEHPEDWNFAEKKSAIKDTIERIIWGMDGRSTIVFRGGLPVPYQSSLCGVKGTTENIGDRNANLVKSC